MNANDIDNRLLAGDLNVDAAGTGVQAAARAKILSTPSLKAQSDNPISGFIWFAYLNTKVAPLNNVHCRMAIEYAANKTNYQTAYGGPVAGGAIAQHGRAAERRRATSPSTCTSATTKPGGDVAKAKAAAQAVRAAERLHHRDHLPQRPAQGGRGRHGAAGLAGPGRDQDHAARLPDRHLRHQLRGRAEVRGPARHRHPVLRLGARLAGRLRLLLLHRRTASAISPAGNTNLAQLNDPVVQRPAHQDGDAPPTRPRPELLHRPDRHAGHEGRGHPAGGVRQVAALPAART